jgi:hypothetical protein
MNVIRWSLLCLLLGALADASADESRPSTRFERAVALLGAPAVSAEDNRHAKAELAAIIADDGSSADALAARYLLGRLRQLEDNETDPPEFQVLRSQHQGHPLAQLAALKVLLRRLYSEGPESPADRLRHGEDLGSLITFPALRSDFHLAMGEAYIFHGDQREPALRHLRAAAALGIPSAATRANVLVQIGELARLTGAKAVAAASYRAFIAEFPRDLRQQIVRDRLAEVEGVNP